MKTRLIIAIMLLLALSSAFAQAYWEWAKNAGGIQNDSGQSIAVDNAGNSYTTGSFEGIATFGTIVLATAGETDIFIAKKDGNGNWIWAQSVGSTSYDSGFGICVDVAGNAYVTGYFYGTVSFGTNELISSGESDIFVAKISSAGVWQWAAKAGSTDWDLGRALTTDTNGNIYTTGRFKGIASFGSNTVISSGDYDVYVAKLDSVGNWLGVLSAGGSALDLAGDISIDGLNNVYITGLFEINISFGATALASYGARDIFVAKASSDLSSWLWANKAGGTGNDSGSSIVTDNIGNSYVTGAFVTSATFGTVTLTGVSSEIFVSKLNSIGDWLWTTNAGGNGNDVGRGIDIDSTGNSYIVGEFYNTCHFGTYNVTSAGNRDVFVSKLNAAGDEWLWAIRAGGLGNDFGLDLVKGFTEEINITGYFADAATFGTTNLISYGNNDMYAAKISVQAMPNTPSNIQITISENQVQISWDVVPNCTYTVYSDSNPEGTFSNVEQTGITATNWSETISAGKLFYRVTAEN